MLQHPAHLLLMILGHLFDTHSQGRLSLLIDAELAVGRQLEYLLVVHPMHVLVHENEPQRHSSTLHLIAGWPQQMHLKL